MGPPRRAWLALPWAMLVAACASAPTSPPIAPVAQIDSAFDASGRLSVRSPRDALAAQFAWSHAPDSDTIDLATPLGATLARLTRTNAGAELELSGGRIEQAESFEVLAERALGAPLPVSGLAWWVRGAPRPGSEHTVERDASGRAVVLRQAGWEIVYGYSDRVSNRPVRLVLSYPEIEVRLVIDGWR